MSASVVSSLVESFRIIVRIVVWFALPLGNSFLSSFPSADTIPRRLGVINPGKSRKLNGINHFLPQVEETSSRVDCFNKLGTSKINGYGSGALQVTP